MTNYGKATEAQLGEILYYLKQYGQRAIVALSGVPGTGKSFLALIAAQRFAGEPTRVRQMQFHPGISYDQFIEGYELTPPGGSRVAPGLFLEWNYQALSDPDSCYVLLLEELTRAHVTSVLGELLTYIEHRDRSFMLPYSRGEVTIARNLAILATFNPHDHSAQNLDHALIRRMFVLELPPDERQLGEMLAGGHLPDEAKAKLTQLMSACKQAAEREGVTMPFGHGVFAGAQTEADLHELWNAQLRHYLQRPGQARHPLSKVVEDHYPWAASDYRRR
jgi:MoxR-like ATPase